VTAMTPLDQAIEAWYRPRNCDRQVRTDDAIALLEWGCFSISHVQEITRLPRSYVRALSSKTSHTGGNLNPETLPLLRDLRTAYVSGAPAAGIAQQVYDKGTKQAMTSVLTGVPMATLYRWMRRG
jgi:hypothetical protein